MSQFDTEVDLLCVGSSPATLIAAISAIEAGMTVLVADRGRKPGRAHRVNPPKSWANMLRLQWTSTPLSDATMAYLHALTDEAGRPELSGRLNALPVRRFEELRRGSTRTDPNVVPPFYGRDLVEWSRACLSSPYGVLCSRVSIAGASEMVLGNGQRIEIRTIPLPARTVDSSLSTWSLATSRQRGVEVRAVGSLQGLMFEDHEVVGARFEGRSGKLRVEARHGVVLSTGQRWADGWPPIPPTAASPAPQLGLVSAVASRFGRLEIFVGGNPRPPIAIADEPRVARRSMVKRSRT